MIILEQEEPKDWEDLQVKVAELFRYLDCKAEVNVNVDGVSAKHKIDVLVTFEFGGI